MTGHFIKISLIVVNLLLNYKWFYNIIGFVNTRKRVIKSVFVAYPATKEYSSKHIYGWYKVPTLWKPYIIGFSKQGRYYTLLTAISSTEEDFKKIENEIFLKKMVERTENIRKAIKAEYKTFAGILPGLLFMKRIIRETPEADVTVDTVLDAEKKIRIIENYPEDIPLIILGGKGFIGRRLIKKLSQSSKRQIFEVDINGYDKNNRSIWPDEIYGRKSILINVSRKNVLYNYIPLCWKEMILLNEVYPEPNKLECSQLKKMGIKAYHVVGVEASAFPKFPGSYKDGVPCCAAIKSDNINSIIKKIT
jgi:hypothetical protein